MLWKKLLVFYFTLLLQPFRSILTHDEEAVFSQLYSRVKYIFVMYLYIVTAKRIRHNIALRITCISLLHTNAGTFTYSILLLHRDIRGMPITSILTSRCNHIAKTNAFARISLHLFLGSSFRPNFSNHGILASFSSSLPLQPVHVYILWRMKAPRVPNIFCITLCRNYKKVNKIFHQRRDERKFQIRLQSLLPFKRVTLLCCIRQ